MSGIENQIARHKTAIRRPSYSLPISCLLRDGLVHTETSVFDYGCGHGQDIELLRGAGIDGDGWDPAHRADGQKRPADVVNLGYVINVIEDPRDRAAAVRAAWELSLKLLVVAAQIEFAAPDKEQPRFADGVLTSRGTFQKYYTQTELREYLEKELSTDAIPAAPGVFYVFKDETTKQQFLATRFHRRIAVPRKRVSELRFEQNLDVLGPLMAALTELGRLPGPEEFPQSADVIERFGSLKKAFALIRRVTDQQPWADIAQRRTEDLLVYLALSRFARRPKLSKLPAGIQRDIKAFLGSYRQACTRADTLLFRAGDPAAIDAACQMAGIGKLVDNALIVHRTALDHLPPLLRIYEGCARALVGDIDEANLIKLHRYSGKVSYIAYPDFDTVAHPPLRLRVKVTLPSLAINFFDYSNWQDPPLLFRKEQFLHTDDPLREKFARLTRQEEKHGLLDQINDSLPASHWDIRIRASGRVLRGHHLVCPRSPRKTVLDASDL
jgi:DNA phosphorothioation-associated putative methyltransferase